MLKTLIHAFQLLVNFSKTLHLLIVVVETSCGKYKLLPTIYNYMYLANSLYSVVDYQHLRFKLKHKSARFLRKFNEQI